LRCSTCARRFLVRDGVPSLLRGEEEAALADFSRGYRQARHKEGWRPLSREQALRLPYGSPPGYPSLYWEVRRQSYRVFAELLSREGPAPERGPAADLGAGNGWLAFRLVQAGYRVLAVEASADDDFGLGAAEVYRSTVADRLLPVQGDLERPPLQPGTLSLVVFNASLHYARDLEATLARAAGSLRPDGCLAILDTPIAPRPRPGSGLGDRHLGRGELEQALAGAGLRPRWISIRRGWRWWVHQAKAWLKRDARFSFPMVLGYRITSTE
jgi:SAM-dependent methyltransferase